MTEVLLIIGIFVALFLGVLAIGLALMLVLKIGQNIGVL